MNPLYTKDNIKHDITFVVILVKYNEDDYLAHVCDRKRVFSD